MYYRNRIVKKGDTVGIICPSSTAFGNEQRLEKFLKLLEEHGLKYKLGQTMTLHEGYLAGNDAKRAKDIMDMYQDEEVSAILCFKGGYGASRIVDLLDYEIIARHPKVIIGYSDITVLLNAIYQKTLRPTIHGQMGITLGREDIDQETIEHFFDTLFNNVDPVITKFGSGFSLVNGIAEGILVGGNLSMLAHLIGTPYEIDCDNKILLLEDVSEEPYAIDRMLAQLKLAGKFDNLRGVIIGYFTDCENKDKTRRLQTVTSLIKEYFAHLGIPVLMNFPTGHDLPFVNCPIGVPVLLDCNIPQVLMLGCVFDCE